MRTCNPHGTGGASLRSQSCPHMVSESLGCREERLALFFVVSKERSRGTERHSRALVQWRFPAVVSSTGENWAPLSFY